MFCGFDMGCWGGGMMVVAEQERCKDGVVVAVDVLTTM